MSEPRPHFQAAQDLDAERQENRRLRELIKDAEFGSCREAIGSAATIPRRRGTASASASCAITCPAFTPEGAVR